MKKSLLIFALALSVVSPVRAEYVLNKGEQVRLGMGGYARFFTGKMEGYQYNNAMKSEGYIKPYLDINEDLTLTGKIAGRYILDDRFPSKNKFKMYDVYGTIKSKRFGSIDIGDLRNVGYLLHLGPKDVGLLDIDDSDIGYFYNTPKNFYAPTLTYLNTDSRDLKISYTTPSIEGFRWGVSAVQSDDNKLDTCASGGLKMDHGKGVITATQYERDFEFFKMGVSAGFAYYHDDRYFMKNNEIDGNHSEYSLGTLLEKEGVSVGASYRKFFYQDKLNIDNVYAWTAGVAYDGDVYGVSLAYMRSHAEYVQKNRYEHLMLSGKYQMNDYMKWTLSTGRLIFESDIAPRHDGYFGIAGLEFKI